MGQGGRLRPIPDQKVLWDSAVGLPCWVSVPICPRGAVRSCTPEFGGLFPSGPVCLRTVITAYGNSPGTLSGLSGPCTQGPQRHLQMLLLIPFPGGLNSGLPAGFWNQLFYEHLVLEGLGFGCLEGPKIP